MAGDSAAGDVDTLDTVMTMVTAEDITNGNADGDINGNGEATVTHGHGTTEAEAVEECWLCRRPGVVQCDKCEVRRSL